MSGKAGTEMESEMTKLAALLDYTIEHNHEHAEDLKNLARKAKDLGKTAVYRDLMRGVEQMDKASETLASALKKLRK